MRPLSSAVSFTVGLSHIKFTFVKLNPDNPVRPKNSAEVRWKIEPQGLLKDSPLCDDATPIPAHRGRRLDEPTPADCHRIPPGRKRILLEQLGGKPNRFTDAQRIRLARKAKLVGRRRLGKLATLVTPDTLRWFRVLVAVS